MARSRSATDREPLSILVLSGSARGASLNTQLAGLATQVVVQHGGTAELVTLADFDTPMYNQDVQDDEGIPPGAMRFRDRLAATDAFIIASPEYNASMPGALKNLIDWVSRFRPQPFHQRHGMVMSASPSMVGGNRGLWSLRVPLEHLGSRVYPDMFSLAQAHQAFTDSGLLANSQLAEFFRSTIVGFMDLAEAGKHYPCMKTAWIEHLGEQLEPA
ncbi:MAG TPA: NAD(P)H-dependent oxidoreductase, partial [Actinomycetes bacterium]|nr:NAD(P)H-dependent oxidoreductase [Actinomycetes bacterium]